MTVQYSIQKMVSDGTLSTIALGIQYLQRNDIYIHIAGEETPQSGAPSGYTWSFINNTTLKILPVVPNGVEVVVYRRTGVDAMYNIYSQNAQFDEATIDENNQQLLYIAQEYLEQGLPGAGVDTLEYVRDDGSFTYYRIKRTDGSYSEEFAVPSASSSTKVLTRESLRRSYAEAGYNLVAGSFEVGGTLVNSNDVLLHEATVHAYSWDGAFPGGGKVVTQGSTPYTTGAWVDRTDVTLRSELAAAAGAELVGYSKGGNVASNLDLVVPENFDDTMYMSTYLFMFEDQTLPVYTRSIFGDRKDYTNRTLHFGVRDDNGGLYAVESDYAVMLDASKIPFPVTDEHYYFTSRLKHHEIDSRQRRQVLFRKVAPTAVTPNNLKYMVIGDSNTNIAFADLLRNTLRARGHNPNFVGTITGQGLDLSETSGPLGEGRSGWSSAHFTNRATTRKPVAIGGEAAYNAMTKSGKTNVNPFVIAGDGAGSFNGYKFDFASYLSRFSIPTPDVVGIGLGPNNLALGGTDYEQIAIDFIADLAIMVDSIWAANPNTKIALYMRGMAKTDQQDTLIEGHRWLQNKLLQFTRSHPKHGTHIWLISSWAHMSQESGYSTSTVTNLSGVIKGDITDGVHSRIYEDTRGTYVASVAPWMAWVAYASTNRGYNGNRVHVQESGKRGMLYAMAPDFDVVPVRQQSGSSASDSINSLVRINDVATGPLYLTGKARGTEQVLENVVHQDALGSFGCSGYVDGKFIAGAALEFFVDGDPVAGSYLPSRARISVIGKASKSRVTSIVFNSERNIEAGADNVQNLGTPSARWSTVFAGTGAINTSDAREKSAPLPIDDAVLDAWSDVQLVTFQWLDAIRTKGEDVARWHFGVIAQQVRDAFIAHGLDGCDYGLLCYDEWKASDAVFDEDGNVVQEAMEAGNRWGIRPDQCLFLEAAYQSRRCDRIEARLSAAGL